MFNVVFRTITREGSFGAITWSTFKDEDAFDQWYNEKMRSLYAVVAKNVTEEEAREFCSTPEAQRAVLVHRLNRASKLLSPAVE